MSGNTETTAQEATEAPQEAQQAAQAPQEPEEQQEAQNPNAEAKRYRLRLRETETQLQAAQERVSNLQRTLAEAQLAAHLSNPSDLWEVGGQDAAEFFSEDGALDQDRLTDAARALVTDRPGLQAARGAYVPKIADAPKARPQDSFTEAFKPVRHR